MEENNFRTEYGPALFGVLHEIPHVLIFNITTYCSKYYKMLPIVQYLTQHNL